MEITADDRFMALLSVVTALMLSLAEEGHLPVDRLSRHLNRAANELEEQNLPGAAAALDELRAHFSDLAHATKESGEYLTPAGVGSRVVVWKVPTTLCGSGL